jgi:enoyl-CoA hydratase/carnithine racemase
MSTEQLIEVEDHSRVRILTLNRPDQLNAFNDAQYDAFRHALNDAATDKGVAVVIITGKGRAFCAGQDLTEMAVQKKYDDGERHGFEPFIETVESFPKPLIAAVNGLGVGIGLTMLPHCDLVLMAEEARLRAPFVALGMVVEAGNSALLPQTVGWANAAHALYTAEWLPAETCKEIGLAWKVVPLDALMDEAMDVASKMAAQPISALVATKALLLDVRAAASKEARARESVHLTKLVGGPANLEAIAAFQEKRAPDFAKLGE